MGLADFQMEVHSIKADDGINWPAADDLCCSCGQKFGEFKITRFAAYRADGHEVEFFTHKATCGKEWANRTGMSNGTFRPQ